MGTPLFMEITMCTAAGQKPGHILGLGFVSLMPLEPVGAKEARSCFMVHLDRPSNSYLGQSTQ